MTDQRARTVDHSSVRPLMECLANMVQLIRSFLTPFASAATGVIIAVVLGVLLGISDAAWMKILAFAGALIGVAPHLKPFFLDLVRIYKVDREERRMRAEKRNPAVNSESERVDKITLEEQEKRRKLLAEEHEARRPICSHCGKKTSAVFRHRKKDGSADGRFRENPLLCNRCFKPYAGVRPWNLPEKKQE